jgi:hypothetical protein
MLRTRDLPLHPRRTRRAPPGGKPRLLSILRVPAPPCLILSRDLRQPPCSKAGLDLPPTGRYKWRNVLRDALRV